MPDAYLVLSYLIATVHSILWKSTVVIKQTEFTKMRIKKSGKQFETTKIFGDTGDPYFNGLIFSIF